MVARPPWWRRLLARRPKGAPAGLTRPPLRTRRRPRFLVPLLALVLLVGAGFAFKGQLNTVVDAVRDRLATPQPIHAVTIKASSEQQGHPAALAADGTTDRYWSPNRAGDGKGEYLEAVFATPHRFVDLVIHPGISDNAQQFLTQARPQSVAVTLTGADGTVTTRTLNLADTAGPQRFSLAVSGVVRIRLTVDSAYGTGQGRRVAIAEVEFFIRS